MRSCGGGALLTAARFIYPPNAVTAFHQSIVPAVSGAISPNGLEATAVAWEVNPTKNYYAGIR